MQIRVLKLLNFRNYDHLEIQFHPHLNLIYGKNGSGKTNLVEAIYVLGLTRSFRLGHDNTLIQKEKELAQITGEILHKYDTTYEISITNEGKNVKINHDKVLKLSNYVAKIYIVLFHPNDLRILKESPTVRRKYINISISQMSISYMKHLNEYLNLMKQRNAYLKKMYLDGLKDHAFLDILTEKMVEHGILIYTYRQSFLEDINKLIHDKYQKITGDEGLNVIYHSDYKEKTKEDILKMYERDLVRDMSLGTTNHGIHKDDFDFLVGVNSLKDYGSEGQQKNAILSLKLSELDLMKEKTGEYPILILDDLFSELDQEKIERIFEVLPKDVQIFITTTDTRNLEKISQDDYMKIKVHDGKVEEEY